MVDLFSQYKYEPSVLITGMSHSSNVQEGLRSIVDMCTIETDENYFQSV